MIQILIRDFQNSYASNPIISKRRFLDTEGPLYVSWTCRIFFNSLRADLLCTSDHQASTRNAIPCQHLHVYRTCSWSAALLRASAMVASRSRLLPSRVPSMTHGSVMVPGRRALSTNFRTRTLASNCARPAAALRDIHGKGWTGRISPGQSSSLLHLAPRDRPSAWFRHPNCVS